MDIYRTGKNVDPAAEEGGYLVMDFDQKATRNTAPEGKQQNRRVKLLKIQQHNGEKDDA